MRLFGTRAHLVLTLHTGEVRVVYLVTAYDHLEHLQRLCRALETSDPGCLVVVQFDSGSARLPRASDLGARVIFTRDRVIWGDGSYADALIQSMGALLADEWDWLVVLSGQDYPVRELSVLHLELGSDAFDAYAPARSGAPTEMSCDDEIVQRYGYRYRWFNGNWPRLARAVVARSARPLSLATGGWLRLQPRPRGMGPGIGRRRRPTPFSEYRPCFMGSDYVAARRRLVEEFVALLEREPELLEHYRQTFIPSESLFATVFRWIAADRVADRNFHFMQYSGRANPRSITSADLPQLWASGAIFARKFDDSATWVEELLPMKQDPS